MAIGYISLTLVTLVFLCTAEDVKNHDNDVRITEMQGTVKSLVHTVKHLQDQLTKQQNEKLESDENRKSLTNKVEKLENEKLESDQKIKSLTSKIDKLENALVAERKYGNLTSAETSDTVFLATISVWEYPISDEEVIVFDTVPINPGGHYNPVLGAYTAPFSGYYQFSVAKQSNNYRSHFWLLVDDQRYAFHDTYTTGANPSGTMTINLQLTAGQIVRVENDYSTIIYGTQSAGDIRSFFTGHMLYAL